MPRYVFHMHIAEGQAGRLLELNEQYGDVLRRVTKAIPGLRSIQKYVLDGQYVEIIDFEGDFANFSAQLTADKETRQFLRSIGGCFVQPPTEMPQREMACIQTLPG